LTDRDAIELLRRLKKEGWTLDRATELRPREHRLSRVESKTEKLVEPSKDDLDKFAAYEKEQRERLQFAESVEGKLYSEAPDPLVEIFREDLLEKDWQGNPRSEEEKEMLRLAWKYAREAFLPCMSYFEGTPKDKVNNSEWILLFGDSGSGKTTLGIYHVFWISDSNPWIKTIYSTTPIYAYSFDYPFVLRDDQGHRLLHPKWKETKNLREIGGYENCLFFADELANLLPGRNFQSRRQWAVTSMSKNFRKRNVYFIATVQREMSPDPELRENFDCLLRPSISHDRLTWRFWRNKDADFSEYMRWQMGDKRVGSVVYPQDDSEADYPTPRLPWLFAAFDSRREVALMFQAPLTPEVAESEARSLMAWIEKTDTGGTFSNWYSRNKTPPEGEFRTAVKAWDVASEKMYSDDELLLIAQEFRRLYHRLPQEELEKPKLEKPRLFACECGWSSPSEGKLGVHIAGIRNVILGLTTRRKPAAQVEDIRRRHPKLAGELSE